MAATEQVEIAIADGLTMRAARFAGGGKTPAVCIPGLTRNARDFEGPAPRIAATGRDVYALSLRGRGASDRDTDYRRYIPPTYRADVVTALDALGLPRAVFIGTSLGGIVTMLTAETALDRIAAAIINDVGPKLATEGIERIIAYTAPQTKAAADNAAAPPLMAPPRFPFEAAAAGIKLINAVAFPDADDAFWAAFTRRTCRENEDGTWSPDFDPMIGAALPLDLGRDLWPGWTALKNRPTLLVRGALSDLLTPPIVEEMRAAHPSFHYVEVPRVGHAPMLDEPAAWSAIEQFLSQID